MAQLLVRNLSEDIVDALRSRAAAPHRSVEAEHRILLETALKAPAVDFRARLAALREATEGRIVTSSLALLREGRDER